MATTIAKHAVMLTANTGMYTAGMKMAARTAHTFGGSLRSVTGMVTGLYGRIAMLAGVGGMGMLVKSSMQAIDKIGKLSDELGMSTEHLTGLGYAAELSGPDIEGLSKGLRMFTRNMGYLAGGITGAEEVADGLRLVGLAAEDLKGLKPFDALLRVADAIAKVNDPALRMAATMKLMGRGGAQLANFFLMGSKGIIAAIEKSDELNESFSRLDAAKVEEANDAVLTMKRAFGGISKMLAIELAPIITEIAERTTDWAVGISNNESGFVSLFDKMAAGADKVYGIFEKLDHTLKQASIDLEKLIGTIMLLERKAVQPGRKAGEWVGQKLAKLTGIPLMPAREDPSSGMASKITADAQAEQDLLDAGPVPGQKKPMSSWFGGVKAGAQSRAESVAATVAERTAAPLEDIDLAGDEKLATAAEALTEKMRSPMQAFMDDIENLDTLYGKGLITQDTYMKAAGEAYSKLSKDGEKYNETLQDQLDLQDAITGGASESKHLAYAASGSFMTPQTPAEQDWTAGTGITATPVTPTQVTPTTVFPTPVFDSNVFGGGAGSGVDMDQLSTLRQILDRIDYMSRTPRAAMAG